MGQYPVELPVGGFNLPVITVGAVFFVYTFKPITIELSSSRTSVASGIELPRANSGGESGPRSRGNGGGGNSGGPPLKGPKGYGVIFPGLRGEPGGMPAHPGSIGKVPFGARPYPFPNGKWPALILLMPLDPPPRTGWLEGGSLALEEPPFLVTTVVVVVVVLTVTLSPGLTSPAYVLMASIVALSDFTCWLASTTDGGVVRSSELMECQHS